MMISLHLIIATAFLCPRVASWTTLNAGAQLSRRRVFQLHPLLATADKVEQDATIYQTIFDFADDSTTNVIERLDDAIMGGISTSSFQNATGQHYARWVGVCREDGGGFCGFRTNPFQEPLLVGDADGLYIVVRLASDTDADRRVWKMSTRTKPDRGELLYQAPVVFQQVDDEWSRIKVPFDTFELVRGPRIIGGTPLNTTGGLYQVGMTMSKFVFGKNLTTMENFRPGFFELQFKEIGLYKDAADAKSIEMTQPKVWSKDEAKKRRPLLLKMLLPISRIFFSEQSQRRKSAMRILTQERKLSRPQAILWGLRSRAQSYGYLPSLIKTLAILVTDSFRSIFSLSLRVGVVYPLRLIRATVQVINRLFKRPTTAS